ncbi:MAG: hypothetical protein GYB67_08115, partial [Chloroflexi bacterium]|nr:hypothetical protein [Chloroflexota bacterium]
VNMYLRDPDAETPASDLPGATPLLNWGVYAAFAGTVIIGILPFLLTPLTDTVTLTANILP